MKGLEKAALQMRHSHVAVVEMAATTEARKDMPGGAGAQC